MPFAPDSWFWRPVNVKLTGVRRHKWWDHKVVLQVQESYQCQHMSGSEPKPDLQYRWRDAKLEDLTEEVFPCGSSS